MKKFIIIIIIGLFTITSCSINRGYPKYNMEDCHWDTNTYKHNMLKKQGKE